MTRYLTASEVVKINEAEAGPDNLGDFGMLESAVFRPMTTVGGFDAYADLHTKAAVLLYSLVRNHPFIDGNKRTAFVACFIFYKLNGYHLVAEQGEVVALVTDAAEGLLDVETIVGVIKGWARPIDLGEVRQY